MEQAGQKDTDAEKKPRPEKYGLCMKCYPTWLYNTTEGNEVVEKHKIRSKRATEKTEKKEWSNRKQKMQVTTHYKENKKYLQIEINRLAKMIDRRFGFESCIDCGRGFTQDMDRDAGHCHSVGSNESIRYNLHNIHGQKSSCNSNGLGGGKTEEYKIGLEQRYGSTYREYVEFEIVRKYKYIGMTKADYPEKLKIVRKLIRDFETFQFEDAIQARHQMNQIIGIYK